MEDINKYLRELRNDFSDEPLDESNVASEPFLQFDHWFREAVKSGALEPNAMTLSTVNENGRPSSRVVLLREYNQNGFAFFTNYESKKAKELLSRPYACLNFFWPELERQVRVEGKVAMHSKEASDNYFNSRPRSSRIGAWSSPQSTQLKNRKELENLVTEFDKKYPTEDVPRPEYWGGFILDPDYFEFWQGRPSRLHDRIFYSGKSGSWKVGRLAP